MKQYKEYKFSKYVNLFKQILLSLVYSHVNELKFKKITQQTKILEITTR